MKRYFFVGIIITSFLIGAPFVSAQQSSTESLQTQISDLLLLIQDLQVRIDALDSKIEPEPIVDTVASTSISIISPDTGGIFKLGEPVEISWSGGGSKVQLGLVDETYESNQSVLGWISVNEKPDSLFVWNGSVVTDITSSVTDSIESLSTGPFKIVAVSIGETGNYCVTEDSDCNYDLSDSYFTILFPEQSDIQASCGSTARTVEAGDTVTWIAFASGGEAPYTYSWSGTDNISVLPTRHSSEGKYLDLYYRGKGLKTAGVTVRDTTGQETYVSCRTPITVTYTPDPIIVLSPNGGENFTLTRGWDSSQFVKVSWASKNLKIQRGDTIQIALQDPFGRECKIGSTSPFNNEEFVGLVSGYVCPGSNWVLGPGQYKIKVYLDRQKEEIFDTSDSYFTLSEPTLDVQAITPSVSTIDSGEQGKFKFVFPSNTIRASLYVHCPRGISAGTPNTCNRYTDVTSYMASSTEFAVAFSNSSIESKDVTANFYVYLPNNPDFTRGVSARVTVRPEPPAGSSSITIVSPNGGEDIHFGEENVYKFTANKSGVVDLTLIPYPSVDAGLVCPIATDIQTASEEVTITLSEAGSCLTGATKINASSYRLFAILKNGGISLATDLSDSSFTITSTSTPAE